MTERAEPVRTCVGCRNRVAKSDLLRVVAVEGSLVPDPRGRLPGRGAHLHPDRTCLVLAERRQAFGRALRLDRAPDAGALVTYVTEQDPDPTERREGGRTDERSMSQHR